MKLFLLCLLLPTIQSQVFLTLFAWVDVYFVLCMQDLMCRCTSHQHHRHQDLLTCQDQESQTGEYDESWGIWSGWPLSFWWVIQDHLIIRGRTPERVNPLWLCDAMWDGGRVCKSSSLRWEVKYFDLNCESSRIFSFVSVLERDSSKLPFATFLSGWQYEDDDRAKRVIRWR